MALPRQLAPMKAVSGDLPTGPGWAYELKWDGMRIVSFVEQGQVRLHSANLKDATVRFPELAGLAGSLPGLDVILDGEVVAFGDDGTPSFSRLQHRMHIANAAEAERRRVDTPVLYLAFDLLHLDGKDVTGLPWTDRRRLLEQVLDAGPSWRVPEVHDDGVALLEAATERRLEGVMAKRRDSIYEPGRRSAAWRKVKVRRQQEFVVGGWIGGEGSREGSLGSVAVGYHDGPGGPLRFAGRAGSGLTGVAIRRLEVLLRPLERETSPFDPPPDRSLVAGVHWVEPEVVVELAFGEWTPDDRLRHPVYLGIRDDVDPAQVVREP